MGRTHIDCRLNSGRPSGAFAMATLSKAPDRSGDHPSTDGPARRRLTVAEYYRMTEAGILGRGERVELIDGEIIDMSPIGVLHAAIVNVLARHVARQCGDSTFVSIQNPLRLDDVNEPEPDLLILRPRFDCYCTAHPTPADTLMVIEVADTSLAYDLDVKVPLYARHGIPEVWVIEAATRRTHVVRAPAATKAGGTMYADVRLIAADEPLPFHLIGGADSSQTDVSLSQLVPGAT
ncbi:MAG: Uma2 family endonuclease [Planctomycetaceae bacterium]